MINNANKYTVSDIFSIDTPVKYKIPRFQREYTWNKENWEQLINDIEESEGSHFIGSIICINQGTDTLSPVLELIDGQQRLTTLSLLFCAIYNLLKEKIDNGNEELALELGNLKYRLVQKNDRSDTKLELSYQNNNLSDYKSVLSEVGILNVADDVRNRGNRRIYKCFRYFRGKLEQLSIDELTALLTKINATMLVKIEVSSHADAFMLFESLNNRGVPLSAIDLIKNKMLAVIESKNISSVDEAFNKWNQLIRYLDDYPVQERFLRQFYNSFKYDERIKVEGAVKATRSNLIRIYETLIARDPAYIFDTLVANSRIYHDLIIPEENEGDIFPELRRELNDLINVQAAPAYIFLLFIASRPGIDVSTLRNIINLLVKYFIRRNITDYPNTRNLDQIFIDLVALVNKTGSCDISAISNYLTADERISSLSVFKEKLASDIYELNVDATRFILSKIEETNITKENTKNFWEKDNSDKLIWTIEHIFPEGRNIPESWVNMIAEGNRDKAESIQSELVHKMGNLTLTAYNQNLSNFDFEKKRDRVDAQGRFIGYKNNLFLNEDLKNRNKWIKEDIVARTSSLIDIALKIFSIDGK